MICSKLLTTAFRSFRKKNLKSSKETQKEIATAGPKWTKKVLKSILAADPIIIFGGSPMSVAVPPIFEAKA
jgi:hypothetical protein